MIEPATQGRFGTTPTRQTKMMGARTNQPYPICDNEVSATRLHFGGAKGGSTQVERVNLLALRNR